MELHDWLVFKNVLRDWPKSGVILHCCGKFHALGLGSVETQKLFGGFLLVKLCCLSFHLSLNLSHYHSLARSQTLSPSLFYGSLFLSLSLSRTCGLLLSLSYSLTFPLSLDTRHISRYLVLLKGHRTKLFPFHWDIFYLLFIGIKIFPELFLTSQKLVTNIFATF